MLSILFADTDTAQSVFMQFDWKFFLSLTTVVGGGFFFGGKLLERVDSVKQDSQQSRDYLEKSIESQVAALKEHNDLQFAAAKEHNDLQFSFIQKQLDNMQEQLNGIKQQLSHLEADTALM